jgi:CRISPR/Cas system-associated protein Csm6
MFAPLSGPEKVELAVLVPAIAAYYAYDWAAKNISLPSLPILRPKLHQFEYKAKFSLENRKKKCEAFNEYTGGMTAMIVERHMHSRLPELPSPRFAARSNTTYRQLCLLLNKRILPVLEGPDIV